MYVFLGICASLCGFAFLVGDSKESGGKSIEVPLGLPPIEWPANNPYSEKKRDLGLLLFFDKRLSTDGTVSCASCHKATEGFSDHRKVSIGILGRQGARNSQTIINSAYHKHLFWDGRAKSLEEQCRGPISNSQEMSNASTPHQAFEECQLRVNNIEGYKPLFQEVFGKSTLSIDEISMAIATFERTVLSGNSRFDQYMAGDKGAMSQEEIDGYRVFKHVGCENCHFGPSFADGRFLNIGIGMDAADPDLGRFAITQEKKDWGAFRVPILRDIEHTPPYMHDGSIETLEEVVEYYDKGGISNPNLHPLMRPLKMSEKDKKNLVAFMRSLTGTGSQRVIEPTSLP